MMYLILIIDNLKKMAHDKKIILYKYEQHAIIEHCDYLIHQLDENGK